ncbi:phospholipase A2 AP-PLA2-I [Strongylocentrotus purpuratus]|uniref:Phospholipase A2 n=1 Tax=Strongylocentrotus purpuratus TaxID=7668 RepID=A0A7M7HFN6_STRPU|nr:phospholipase A2 AP-PLA2-I [Strongylocentrotus purpuratus]|eukprot:XP_011671613.1 PREDICTED: phospholipase A2 AP-PLA2-I [Strongylocentrotus purpuratus]
MTMPQTKSVGQFGVMMGCLLDMSTIEAGLDYNGYGCYCGFGGQGVPLDDTDRCCQTHDDCYSVVQNSDMCRSSNQAYTITYNYNALQCGTYRAQIVCSDASSYDADYKYTDCAMAMCACDKAGSECFQRYRPTYNEGYKRYDKDSC